MPILELKVQQTWNSVNEQRLLVDRIISKISKLICTNSIINFSTRYSLYVCNVYANKSTRVATEIERRINGREQQRMKMPLRIRMIVCSKTKKKQKQN